MKINYRVNGENLEILIKKNLDNSIINTIERLRSDKKILLVYDKNINKNLINKFVKILKTSGCKVIALKFNGKRFDCGSIKGYLEAINYFAKKIFKHN